MHANVLKHLWTTHLYWNLWEAGGGFVCLYICPSTSNKWPDWMNHSDVSSALLFLTVQSVVICRLNRRNMSCHGGKTPLSHGLCSPADFPWTWQNTAGTTLQLVLQLKNTSQRRRSKVDVLVLYSFLLL